MMYTLGDVLGILTMGILFLTTTPLPWLLLEHLLEKSQLRRSKNGLKEVDGLTSNLKDAFGYLPTSKTSKESD